MQRKPEDRVFPYNSQTCLVRLKQIIWYYNKCIVSKLSIININHRRHSYHLLCRHTSSTIKTAIHVLEIGFLSWVEARGKLLSDSRHSSKCLRTPLWSFGTSKAGRLLLLRISYSWTHVSRSLQTYNRGASFQQPQRWKVYKCQGW